MSDLPHVVEIPFLDPLTAFAAFAEEPFAVFLDSALAGERGGRYSFIAVEPFETLLSKDGRIEQAGGSFAGDPFEALRGELARHSMETVAGIPPFQGGAAGYFAYDLCHHLEKLPKLGPEEPAFPDLVVGLYDAVVAFDNLERRAWIVSSGYPEREPEARERRAKARAEAIRARVGAAPGASFPGERARDAPGWTSPIWHADCERRAYEAKVGRVIDYIYAGDIFQANLSREIRARLPAGLHPFRLYARLRALNPAPFAAYLGFGEVAIASSSPERFLRVSDGWVETRPIKGTCRRGETPERDRELAQSLLASEKDRAENVMIVDLLRNDLSRVCRAHTVEARELCVLETFATVHHLTSTVVGRLNPRATPVDLLRAAFPGGSITGAPKIRAMQIIAELEGRPRGPHFGSIGYIGFDGAMDSNIAIRTVAIKDATMTIRVGGGIVADSDPGREFEETEAKAEALLRAAESPD